MTTKNFGLPGSYQRYGYFALSQFALFVPITELHAFLTGRQNVLAHWNNVMLMTCLMGMPELRYCPACQDPGWLAPGCGEAQCPSCKFEFCPTCMLPKHAAIRCSAVCNMSMLLLE